MIILLNNSKNKNAFAAVFFTVSKGVINAVPPCFPRRAAKAHPDAITSAAL